MIKRLLIVLFAPVAIYFLGMFIYNISGSTIKNIPFTLLYFGLGTATAFIVCLPMFAVKELTDWILNG